MIARMALDFLPELPLAERVARHVLAQIHPDYRYDLVDETEVRRALAERYAGHVIPETIEMRGLLLEDEVERVGVVLAVVADTTGVALAILEAGP